MRYVRSYRGRLTVHQSNIPARAGARIGFATREGSAFDRHNLTNRQLKAACKRLGLVGVNWHWLRHANATLLDAVGTPLGTVQALLGHSSSEITREVYLHSIPADARAAVEKVEDLLNRPKFRLLGETEVR